jgi:hypothetical protein
MDIMWKKPVRISITTGLLFAAFYCAPPPTEKELTGRIKANASLRLADGSPISRDDSDEYNPYIVRLSDDYLVLVFGSDRNGQHNIFMAKSVEPFDGFELPFFESPIVVTDSASAIDDPDPINFAAVANGTGVDLYINLHTDSYFIRKGNIADPSTPDISPALASITNTSQADHTIIGVTADGTNLLTTDFFGTSYHIDPNQANPGDPYGFPLDYATSATQVRQDNTGYQDSVMGVSYGSSLATTADFPFGPIFMLDDALLEAGLYLTQLNTVYGANSYEDLVIFAANDGLSDDIYVITSHTSSDLWFEVAGFGFDTFLPPAPEAEHFYDFESAFDCSVTFPTDVSVSPGGWNATACAIVTQASPSYNGSSYANFSGSPNINLGAQNLGAAFTISAWIYVNPTACDATLCTIVANSTSTSTATGFRLVYTGAPGGTLQFITGNGSTTQTAESIVVNDGLPFDIEDGFWHHIAVTSTPANGAAFIYLDGGLVNNTYASETTYSTNTANLWLGMMTDSQNAFFGKMDDVKFYSYELDPTAILALFLE